MLYKFNQNDLFYNRIEAHPYCEFFIYQGHVYYNSQTAISGAHTATTTHVPTGYLSLYEENIDRTTDSLIYPFVVKNGSKFAFKTVDTDDYNDLYVLGDIITGSYPLSASISIEHMPPVGSLQEDDCRDIAGHLVALQNTLNYYGFLSPHYYYSSSYGDKSQQRLAFIHVPSIFYGSSIEKGSVSLKWYLTGSLLAELNDNRENGELIQTGPSGSLGSGSIAGVVLYNEGLILLTGSWALHSSYTDNFGYCPNVPGAGNPYSASWVWWGASISPLADVPSSSFLLSFDGTNYIPSLTMLCHAPKQELNDSNNPTFVEWVSASQRLAVTGSSDYIDRKLAIKNTVASVYPDPEAAFKRQTFISRVAIYDENKKVIVWAKLAVPIKKTEEREFTIKAVLDL
jgi:hypothetical protein